MADESYPQSFIKTSTGETRVIESVAGRVKAEFDGFIPADDERVFAAPDVPDSDEVDAQHKAEVDSAEPAEGPLPKVTKGPKPKAPPSVKDSSSSATPTPDLLAQDPAPAEPDELAQDPAPAEPSA